MTNWYIVKLEISVLFLRMFFFSTDIQSVLYIIKICILEIVFIEVTYLVTYKKQNAGLEHK